MRPSNNLLSQFKIILGESRFSFFTAILTVIVLSLHVQYIPPLMILWVIAWIYENYGGFKALRGKDRLCNLLFILFISFYSWQAIGLIYTADIRMGLLDLFSRLALLVFPLVLISPGKKIRLNSDLITRIYALAVLMFVFWCFARAVFLSFSISQGNLLFNPHPGNIPWLSYFYASDLANPQHPSYVAMYVLLAVFISFESGFDKVLNRRKRILWFVCGLFLLVSQYFLSSRAGLLASFILVPPYFIFRLRHIKRTAFVWVTIIALIIVLIPVIMRNQRVDYLMGKILNKPANYERKDDPRIKIWKSAYNLFINNKLIGVGIGDVRNELASEYIKIGEKKMAEERLNAHNQFIGVVLESGLIGLLIFISMFIVMIIISVRERNILYLLFTIISVIFFSFESVLYRLAGVTFFSLFSFLLLNLKNSIAGNHINKL